MTLLSDCIRHRRTLPFFLPPPSTREEIVHTRATLPYFWVLETTDYDLPSKGYVPATYTRCVLVKRLPCPLEEGYTYYAMHPGLKRWN